MKAKENTMKTIALIVWPILLGACESSPRPSTFEVPGSAKFGVIVSSSSDVRHGKADVCTGFEGEDCVAWSLYGYGFFHKVSGTWEVAGLCTSNDMSEGPCEISWAFDDDDASATFILPEDPITARFDSDLLKLSDGLCSSSWGGIDVELNGIIAKSIEFEGTMRNDEIYCSSTGCFVLSGTAGFGMAEGYDRVDLKDGSSTKITVYGGGGNDYIEGCSSCVNSIDGGSGNDTLHGGDSDDFLYGGSDNDRIFGQKGDDIIYGGSGDDEIYGGSGDDVIRDDGGSTSIVVGDEGVDWIKVENITGSGFVSGRLCSWVSGAWFCYNHSTDQYDFADCGCLDSMCGKGNGSYTDCNDYDPEHDYCDDDC